ncbi:hypothetical protein GF356_13145 [candidate division GN15 bacterium]|nr:hypothetical protein [candidate division GN15 bacterium]
MARWLVILPALMMLLAGSVGAESEQMKKFKSDYSTLSEDLLNNPGERAQVENFVYKKDVATITFIEGELHLGRAVDGRPTTLTFRGKGNCTIDIPVPSERNCLHAVSGKETIDEDFEFCFIEFSDNLDLRLKEQFEFTSEGISWKNFHASKEFQGEVFFKPNIYHTYDNYFQLLRSHYERAEDGYLFIDFNRYAFTFDPNRPEQVQVGYEFEGGDVVLAEAAAFQRQERGLYEDSALSKIQYPTRAISKHGDLVLSGLDGKRIDEDSRCDLSLVIERDSLRFVSLWLSYNLSEDSVYVNGAPVDYHRRKDFEHIGLILPEYAFKGDTLKVSIWYDGSNYDYALPYVQNPQPSLHTFSFTVPGGSDYFMPGMGPYTDGERGKDVFEVAPQNLYNRFYFTGFVTGADTMTVTTDAGLMMNFIKLESINKQALECFIPDATYEAIALESMNYFSSLLGGNPPGVFGMYVVPEQSFVSMPGMMTLPQDACVTSGTMEALGGFHLYAGYAASRQWFGNLMKPTTHRDTWIESALASYLPGLLIERKVNPGSFYSNMLNRRDTLLSLNDVNRLRPISISDRGVDMLIANKGAWLVHMLRLLMLDLETMSDRAFTRFLFEASFTFNNRLYTTNDFIALAEKHYGEPLDWFFNYWLYDYPIPRFDVEWTATEDGGEYIVDATVATQRATADFKMPVIMRVETADGQSVFVRETIDGTEDSFSLGPFASEPVQLHFNEFLSVLCHEDVSRR